MLIFQLFPLLFACRRSSPPPIGARLGGSRPHSHVFFRRGATVLSIFFLSLCMLWCAGEPVLAQGVEEPEQEVVKSGLILVTFLPGSQPTFLFDEAAHLNLQVTQVWPEFGVAAVRAPGTASGDRGERTARIMASLADMDGVNRVELDSSLTAATDMNGMVALERVHAARPDNNGDDSLIDPLLSQQWAMTALNVAEGWQISRGSAAMPIALIDSGYDFTHEDLGVDSLWRNESEMNGLPLVDDDGNDLIDDYYGWDWVEGDGNMNDPFGHGTHVGSIIGAVTNNGIGISGLGENLRLMPLRVLNEEGKGYLSDLLSALAYARQENVKIINLSLVMAGPSPALEQALALLAEEGRIIVAATGNYNGDVLWPAAYPETLAVAALDQAGARAYFSNFGPEVALAAPGVEIIGAYHDNSYAYLSGTSMATPHVSVLAGLLWSLRPDLDAAAIRRLMAETAVDVNAADLPGPDEELGAGRIDFAAALNKASADLRLIPQQADLLTIAAGSTGRLGLVVETPAAGATAYRVDGAVTRHWLEPIVSDATLPIDAPATTAGDTDGEVDISFAAPYQPGDYRLVVELGSSGYVADIQVITATYTITIAGDQIAYPAGSEAYPLVLTVLDAVGQTAKEPVTVALSASLGSFGSGEANLSLTVEGGQATIEFVPGEEAGRAEIRGAIGAFEIVLGLDVLPGPVVGLALKPLPEKVVVYDEPVVLPLECVLTDAYGNPVVDGTPAEWVIEGGGEETISETTTEGGRALGELVLEPGSASPVRVQLQTQDAIGRLLTAEAALETVAHHQWLPLVLR